MARVLMARPATSVRLARVRGVKNAGRERCMSNRSLADRAEFADPVAPCRISSTRTAQAENPQKT